MKIDIRELLKDVRNNIDAIEEAMNRKEPRVIWVRECDHLKPDSQIVFEQKDKPEPYGDCCRFTKFQEVIE